MFNKFKLMLSKKQLLNVYFFIFLSFIAMFLETLGIGLIIPFLQTLISDDTNKYLLVTLNYLNIYPDNKTNLILILIIILACVYTFKAVFLTYFSYIQNKIVADTRFSLSNKLYEIYLNKPYSFHLDNNSSKLIRNIQEIDLVVVVLRFLIILISEIIVVLGISVFIIIYEPFGSISLIFFFGIVGYLFCKKVQTKSKIWGEKRQVHQGKKIKFLQEGFRAIKDIKILQRSKELIKNFLENNSVINQSEFKNQFVDSLPRLWLEWLVVQGFVMLILLMLFKGEEINYIIPLLGLFAAASFRIMPSLTRIMNAAQGIFYHRPTVNSVYKEFKQKNIKVVNENKFLKNIVFDKKILLKNISFKYSDSAPLILDNVNLEIKKGETVGFLGESGIGKTTLINLILGLIKPTSGNVYIDKKNMFENVDGWQSQIGYVPQNIYLSDETIRQNIAFALPEKKINDSLVKKAIVNAKLEKLIDSLNKGINTRVGEFGDRISGGQKQRIAIARALYKDPEVLVLDECTNSLDLNTEKEIINEISHLKGKKTIIMITHRLSTLENCDHIYEINKNGIEKKINKL